MLIQSLSQEKHKYLSKDEETEINRKLLKLIPILACLFMLLTGGNAASGEELSAPIIKEFDEGRGSFVKIRPRDGFRGGMDRSALMYWKELPE